MCPVVPEVAGSLNWCGTGSEFTRVACRVAVLNSFMMVDASLVNQTAPFPSTGCIASPARGRERSGSRD